MTLNHTKIILHITPEYLRLPILQRKITSYAMHYCNHRKYSSNFAAEMRYHQQQKLCSYTASYVSVLLVPQFACDHSPRQVDSSPRKMCGQFTYAQRKGIVTTELSLRPRLLNGRWIPLNQTRSYFKHHLKFKRIIPRTAGLETFAIYDLNAGL